MLKEDHVQIEMSPSDKMMFQVEGRNLQNEKNYVQGYLNSIELKEHNFPIENTIDQANNTLFRETFHIKNEFEYSLKNNNYAFCTSKQYEKAIANEKFIQCKNCFRDYCENCYEICHKDCPKVLAELLSYIAIQHISACHCTHTLGVKEYSKFFRLECFYSNFFFQKFELEGKNKFYKLKDKGTIICFFCSILHGDTANIEGIKEDNLDCKCEDRTHCSFNARDLLYLFNQCFELNKKEVNYKDLIFDLENDLKIYLRKYYEIEKNFDLDNLVEYEVAKFSSYNLIFNNGLLNASLNDEFKLMEKFIQKLETNDYYFYNYEKINMALTYIFHFYRNYFFLDLECVEEQLLDNLPLQSRLNKLQTNTYIYQKIKNKPYIGEFFSIEKINFIFESLLKLNHFRISDFDDGFLSFFLLNFLRCYCFSEKEIFILLKFAREIKYKENDDEFNNDVRVKIESIYKIAQNNLIDYYQLNLLKNNNHIPNEINPNIIEKYYFFDNQEYFEDYFKKIFSDENIYLHYFRYNNNPDNREDIIYLSFCDESIYFLNCFHYNYLEQFSHKLNLLSEKTIDQQSSEFFGNSIFRSKNKYQVRRFNKVYVQYFGQNKIETYLDFILTDCFPFIDLKQIIDFEGFINHLFNSLRLIYKNQAKNDSQNSNTKIDISLYLNKHCMMDISNLNIKKYGEELKYIFYECFHNLEKIEPNNEILKKWNLLLFLLISNKNNALFILKKLQFLDFLFYTEEYLKSYILKVNENEKDFVWRLFYYVYKFIIHNSELSSEYYFSIQEGFLDVYNYQIKDIYEKSKEKDKLYLKWNNYLAYYYLKIEMRKSNSFQLKKFFPFRFNTTYSAVMGHLEYFSEMAFESNFDIEKYLYNIESSECLINKSNFEEKNETSFYTINANNFKYGNLAFDNFNEETEKLFNSNLRKPLNNEIQNYIFSKNFDIYNIQYLLFRIIAGVCITRYVNIYFKIINKNFYEFKKFFENKNHLQFKFSDKAKQIKKLEIVILNLILKFLVLKSLDAFKLDLVIDLSFSKDDLKTLVKSKSNIYLETSIDLISKPLESKFIIYKTKCKILQLLDIFISTIEDFEFNSENEKIINFRLYLIY